MQILGRNRISRVAVLTRNTIHLNVTFVTFGTILIEHPSSRGVMVTLRTVFRCIDMHRMVKNDSFIQISQRINFNLIWIIHCVTTHRQDRKQQHNSHPGQKLLNDIYHNLYSLVFKFCLHRFRLAECRAIKIQHT